MTIALGSRVKAENEEIEGRVSQIIDYINGSRHYGVAFKGTGILDDGLRNIKLHEIDLEVISEDGCVDTPVADERFPLGTHVEVLPHGEFQGIVDALIYSSSGCVEYEVVGFVHGVGIKRFILDAEILVAIPEQDSVAVGSSGGSYSRDIAVR